MCLSQGGKIYGSVYVQKYFERNCFTILPTDSDSSHQLGHVEQTHCTVTRIICAQLFLTILTSISGPIALIIPSVSSMQTPVKV